MPKSQFSEKLIIIAFAIKMHRTEVKLPIDHMTILICSWNYLSHSSDSGSGSPCTLGEYTSLKRELLERNSQRESLLSKVRAKLKGFSFSS